MSPLTLNPAPVTLTLLMVIVAFPEFVRVTGVGSLLATTIFPKFTLPGFALRVLPEARALPVRVIVCGEVPALS